MRIADLVLTLLAGVAAVALRPPVPDRAGQTSAPLVVEATAVEIADDSGSDAAAPAPDEAPTPTPPASETAVGLWTDDKGRRRKPLPDTARRPRDLREAVVAFSSWLRDEDYTAWMSSDDMLEAYEAWAADTGTEQVQGCVFLEALGAAPGVEARRRRLNAPELALIKRRLKRERAELYRVMSHDEMAEAVREGGPAAPAVPADARVKPRVTAARTRPERKRATEPDLFGALDDAPAAPAGTATQLSARQARAVEKLARAA
jgi:hypothetical protein